MNTKSITESALIAVITLILCLISFYIPLFSGITYFLMPIPTIILYKRNGLISAFLSSITASLLLLFFMDPLNALLNASFIILPGLSLGYSYYNNFTGGKRTVYGYFGYFIAVIFEIALVQFITGVSFVEEFTNEINSLTTTLKDTYQAAGLFDTDQGAELSNNIDTVIHTIKMLLPTIMLLIPLIFSYCSVLITDLFFKYLKIKYIPIKGITEWKFSTFTKNSLAIVTLLVVLLSYVTQNTNYEIYAFTLENIITGIYALMGISFIFWFLQFKFKKKLIFVRIIILLLCFTLSFMISILMLIGIFDIYFDLRKFIIRRKNE